MMDPQYSLLDRRKVQQRLIQSDGWYTGSQSMSGRHITQAGNLTGHWETTQKPSGKTLLLLNIVVFCAKYEYTCSRI